MVFVDPVHEECVRYFELDELRADLERDDRPKPRLEGLRTAESALDRLQDLLPELSRQLRLHGMDGHSTILAERVLGAFPRGSGVYGRRVGRGLEFRGGRKAVDFNPAVIQIEGVSDMSMHPSLCVVAGPPFLHTLSTVVDPGPKEANGTEGSRWGRTIRKPFSKLELYMIASATGSGSEFTLPPGGRKASI